MRSNSLKVLLCFFFFSMKLLRMVPLRKLGKQKGTHMLAKQVKHLSSTGGTQDHKINLRKSWKPEDQRAVEKTGRIPIFSCLPTSVMFLWQSAFLFLLPLCLFTLVRFIQASQVALVVKNPSANAGDTGDAGLISGLGRSPGEGNGNPLQYSCLENPMDRAWWATVHRLQSHTQLK